jgi:hypothetical protein
VRGIHFTDSGQTPKMTHCPRLTLSSSLRLLLVHRPYLAQTTPVLITEAGHTEFSELVQLVVDMLNTLKLNSSQFHFDATNFVKIVCRLALSHRPDLDDAFHRTKREQDVHKFDNPRSLSKMLQALTCYQSFKGIYSVYQIYFVCGAL